MTGQLITIYRIEVEGRAYQWQKVDDISIDRIIINKKKVDIDFRYNNGKGDSKMNMKEVQSTEHESA